MIPEEAVEAAIKGFTKCAQDTAASSSGDVFKECLSAALEAAAPYMLAGLRVELVNLAKDFDAAEGGTLAYTSPNGLRKNAHDQLMYIVENYLGEQPHD